MKMSIHGAAARRLSLAVTSLAAVGILTVPADASAACANGDLLDCNPVGQTLNPAARFVDPNPPAGWDQCAGFINTDQDDVDRLWENNCLPFKGGELWLRLYDLQGNIIAGAHLFDGVGCPWGVTHLGYDTDTQEGEGLLGHSGTCDSANATTFAWYTDNGDFCGCGNFTCNDIFTANQANNKIFYVGAETGDHTRELVYGPPGPKDTCSLDANAEIHFAKLAVYVPKQILDGDGDGIPDDQDNCPNVANPGQEDGDGDGLGDACDVCPDDLENDGDGDGVCEGVDNCPIDANPGQEDADADGTGDACDICPADAANDVDGDAVCGDVDNCPEVGNAGQEDGDADAIGDACDNCPGDANPGQEDADMNGVGDACEMMGTTTDGTTTDGTTTDGTTTDGTTTDGTTTDGTTTGPDSTSTGEPGTTTDASTSTGTGSTTSDSTSTGVDPTGTVPTTSASDSDATTGASSSTGDTGDSDSGSGSGGEIDDGGCACAADGGGPGPALWLGLLGLGLRRRRRG